METIVKLCDKILENKDLQSILRNPKEVQRIARATAGSSEVSLYGRLRFVLRLTKGALSIGAVAAIVYFVYVWASTGSLPFFLSRYSVVLKPLLGKAREVVSGLTEKAASRAWDAAQAASTYADKAWNTTSSYANDAWDASADYTNHAWDATANYTNNAWNATSAFREAAKNATSEAYANIKNTSLSDLAQSGYNYFLNILSGGDQDKKHLLFENILFDLSTKLNFTIIKSPRELYYATLSKNYRAGQDGFTKPLNSTQRFPRIRQRKLHDGYVGVSHRLVEILQQRKL